MPIVFLKHSTPSKQKTKTMLYNIITIKTNAPLMKKIIILLAIFTTVATMAQSVAINADGSAANASAILDVSSTTKGFLPPRMTLSDRTSITTPAQGLIIYCANCGGARGELQYYNGTAWVNMVGGAAMGLPVPLPSVTIGSQDWTITNLDVTKYRNGDIIQQVTNPADWAGLTTGAWCYYANNSANGTIYGKLYNWYAVNDPRGLAPVGWHIPTNAEWTTLITTLGGGSAAGGKMKETGLAHWQSPNTNATNSSGFTALPGGYRVSNVMMGDFYDIGAYGFWWSSSETGPAEAWRLSLSSIYGDASNYYSNKYYGFSVRCLRD